MEEQQNWKSRTLLIGAVVGALAGVIGAYILVQQAEQNQKKPKLTAGEGVKVGIGLLGLLRMVAELGSKR